MPLDDPDPFGNEHRDDYQPRCHVCGELVDYRTSMMLCPDCAVGATLAQED